MFFLISTCNTFAVGKNSGTDRKKQSADVGNEKMICLDNRSKTSYCMPVLTFMKAAVQNLKKLSPPNLTQPIFSRGNGYWTSTKDECSENVFKKLMSYNSQRENWYTVSPYIAEFGCALSNVGFFLVGYKHNSSRLVFAGLASAISHSVPTELLHKLDFLGVAVASTLVYSYSTEILGNPTSFLPYLGVLGLANFMDALLARTYGTSVPHYVWHFVAAAVADQFLNQVQQFE